VGRPEAAGLTVQLVNARAVKNVPGRRFATALDHLSNQHPVVRVGSFAELGRLAAEDSEYAQPGPGTLAPTPMSGVLRPGRRGNNS
jgi:hypothetical protein